MEVGRSVGRLIGHSVYMTMQVIYGACKVSKYLGGGSTFTPYALLRHDSGVPQRASPTYEIITSGSTYCARSCLV